MTRRERAIGRLTGRTTRVTHYDNALFDAYEAELAADLESDETVQRAVRACWEASGSSGCSTSEFSPQQIAEMRAALRSVLEDR